MAIDRIGKGAGLPGGVPSDPSAPAVKPAGGAPSVDAPFKVDRPDSANAAQRAGSAGSVESTSSASPLGRLRAGEVDVHGYIDLKVDEATSSLKGLSAAELDEIKSVLRDQMKSDPGLADLVRTATGKMPTPPED
jgi:hypothetical protein